MGFRAQIVSDVHVEFHRDGGREWANKLPVGDCDVLIVAGDFGTRSTLMAPLRILCRRFPHVVYVTGNHEYWGSSFEEIHRELELFAEVFENFHWLNNSSVIIGGQRIIGTTLWFSKTPDTWRYEWGMNDFREIEGSQRIYEENTRALEYLYENTRKDDIVVTHHLPSNKCVSPRFVGNQMNAFFVCDVESLIVQAKPALWVHGHTHDSKDLYVGNTRIVCNPFGYAGQELNRDYMEPKIVEV